jgi:hypothetical protein
MEISNSNLKFMRLILKHPSVCVPAGFYEVWLVTAMASIFPRQRPERLWNTFVTVLYFSRAEENQLPAPCKTFHRTDHSDQLDA